MAIVASQDGRSGVKGSIFRDVIGNNLCTIEVPQGRGLAEARPKQQLKVTSDLVVVCWDALREALARIRKLVP